MGKYSDILMDHFTSPRNGGRMEEPDLVGVAGSPERPPYLVVQLRVREGRVVEAKFQTNGCGASIASGSMLTELVTQRTIEECLELTAERLAEALGGVPADKLHCPVLAVGALRDALKDYVP